MDSDKQFCISDSIAISDEFLINKNTAFSTDNHQSIPQKDGLTTAFFEFRLVEINEFIKDIDLDIDNIVGSER